MQGSKFVLLSVYAGIAAVVLLLLLFVRLPGITYMPKMAQHMHGLPMGAAYPSLREAYLKLVENAVTGSLFDEIGDCGDEKCTLAAVKPFNAQQRQRGNVWPAVGHTMVGHIRLKNVRDLLHDVMARKVPGDFVELGVWRGGVCIFAKAIMDTQLPKEYRKVFVMDAFDALPGYKESSSFLANSEFTVRHNFEKYGLLDDRVVFIKGLFNHTLPGFATAHGNARFSMLRIDSNFYDSYQDCFYYMYERLSVGGYLIMDDIRSAMGDRVKRGEVSISSQNNMLHLLTGVGRCCSFN
jgi:hypothetical protein